MMRSRGSGLVVGISRLLAVLGSLAGLLIHGGQSRNDKLLGQFANLSVVNVCGVFQFLVNSGIDVNRRHGERLTLDLKENKKIIIKVY